MGRTDVATRLIPAPPERVYAALVDPAALEVWLPPSGMSGRFERFDLSPGGGYRLVLAYDDPALDGKSRANEDVVEARFVAIVPGERIVQAIDFIADDPALAGTMTMTWSVTPAEGGALAEIRADDVPEGISAADHATGMSSSLEHLADYLAEASLRTAPGE
ncbi:SRPBCC domain-containing protein [Nocardioides sp.]|jgi:uncharacterized protein YndB with AHSA1/START domain|uniref:SRPBCC domain-containing protein n=1 Tax=Nocardioides sp. TaxID=35761 RepID=UPI002BB7A18B|nr:SRPBCC domain-containing protein [Nocardioides sp.]HVX54231.1 SRPBCC domain-containing protein [Nocardioides sp.]